jgi:acyl-CoA-binding protein
MSFQDAVQVFQQAAQLKSMPMHWNTAENKDKLLIYAYFKQVSWTDSGNQRSELFCATELVEYCSEVQMGCLESAGGPFSE